MGSIYISLIQSVCLVFMFTLLILHDNTESFELLSCYSSVTTDQTPRLSLSVQGAYSKINMVKDVAIL